MVRKYRHELHANEIVLLAYYLAAVNIEQTFHALSGRDYEPFPGIVLTDTFQQGESRKDFMGQESFPENNERLAMQNETEIRVIVSNPPYSVGQNNENDDNKNLRYPYLDARITQTYAAESNAKTKKALYDSYIRAIRWASDRIKSQGVIGFVTNGMFIDSTSADGLRKCLEKEFSSVYCFNLRGDQLHSLGEQSRREGGKIFDSGSRQPVAISILVKNPKNFGTASIYYCDIGDYLTREEKLDRIASLGNVTSVPWNTLTPNAEGDWVNQRSDAFARLVPLGEKSTKAAGVKTIFDIYSLGVRTNRDAWAYNSSRDDLSNNMSAMIHTYSRELAKLQTRERDVAATAIDNNPRHISWSANLKSDLAKGRTYSFDAENIVTATYRPFNKQFLYFDRAFNERVYQNLKLFPSPSLTNMMIAVSGNGGTKDFSVLIMDQVADLNAMDAGAQCFPLYFYERVTQRERDLFTDQASFAELDWVRQDAVTHWALDECRARYGPSITKPDIFYYVYGLLHSPDYRARFAADLKKILPRIPFVDSKDEFWTFSKSGMDLAKLHLNYESVEPWPVEEVIEGSPRDTDELYRVREARRWICR